MLIFFLHFYLLIFFLKNRKKYPIHCFTFQMCVTAGLGQAKASNCDMGPGLPCSGRDQDLGYQLLPHTAHQQEAKIKAEPRYCEMGCRCHEQDLNCCTRCLPRRSRSLSRKRVCVTECREYTHSSII